MSSNTTIRLKPLLVCPLCKGALAFSPVVISCTGCGEQFPQQSSDWFDLLPDRMLEGDWHRRQDEMEAWYENLAMDTDWAAHCFANDYEPFVPLLASVSGRILDLGGGNGVVRHYLPEGVRYVNLEPSLDWLGAQWTSLTPEFPCLKTHPPFVRAVGEHLPFRAETFDAVLALWTLNHVSQPERVFQEAHRILKPDGLFLAILEDMEPGWLDLLSPAFRRQGMRRMAALAGEKLRCMSPHRKWPVQDDHIRLREEDLRRWLAGSFEITQRKWIGGYLTYEVHKHTPSNSRPLRVT